MIYLRIFYEVKTRMIDYWDVKKIDSQIEALKGSLSSLQGACSSAQSSICIGDVSCTTAANLASVCASQIVVIQNQITLLNYMKQFIKIGVPNPDYNDLSKAPGRR